MSPCSGIPPWSRIASASRMLAADIAFDTAHTESASPATLTAVRIATTSNRICIDVPPLTSPQLPEPCHQVRYTVRASVHTAVYRWSIQLWNLSEQLVQTSGDVKLPPRQDLPTGLLEDDLGKHILLNDSWDLPKEGSVDQDDNLVVLQGELRCPPRKQLLDVGIVSVEPAVGERYAPVAQLNPDPRICPRNARKRIDKVTTIWRTNATAAWVSDAVGHIIQPSLAYRQLPTEQCQPEPVSSREREPWAAEGCESSNG